MAIDGLKRTGVYHKGVRYAMQAHYPDAKDYTETSTRSLPECLAFIDKHTTAGANVQVHKHTWVETFTASGYYKARKG